MQLRQINAHLGLFDLRLHGLDLLWFGAFFEPLQLGARPGQLSIGAGNGVLCGAFHGFIIIGLRRFCTEGGLLQLQTLRQHTNRRIAFDLIVRGLCYGHGGLGLLQLCEHQALFFGGQTACRPLVGSGRGIDRCLGGRQIIFVWRYLNQRQLRIGRFQANHGLGLLRL